MNNINVRLIPKQNINVKLTPPQGIRVEDTTVYVYDNSSIGDGILTIQKNSETIDTFTANSKVDKTVNITVPTQASDIGALPDTTVIPTVNDATLTIQKNGSNVATFTANSSSNATANITVPTKTSDLTNDDGFITGISSSDITTALGYIPADSSSLATVATSGSYNDLSNKPTIPTVNNPTITFTQGGVEKGSITLNQSSNETIALDAGGGGSLPSQTGNAGKFLTTDGTDPNWSSITIPTVNDATLTIQKNGTSVATFTANSSTNQTANITVPTTVAELTDSSNYVLSSSLSSVATSGLYSDLTGTPTIPTVNNSTITITQGGVTKGSFTLNQASGDTIALDAGGGSSLPSQTGNTGKFLTTDGTDASWGRVKTNNLFDFKLTDYLLNDQNWLRADTFSWQDGTVYSDAYDHLVDDIDGKTATSETVGSYTISYYLADDGHKITTDETNVANIYNESGIAWYYILDTVNQRFKLPRTKYGFVGLRDTVGKYVQESLPNIKGDPTYCDDNASDVLIRASAPTGCFVQKNASRTINSNSTGGSAKTATFDASASCSTYQDDAPVQQRSTQMYLYFYIGKYTETATEQTAGLNSELFNGKVDLNAQNLSAQGKSLISGLSAPSNTYEDLTLLASGESYTAPANGYFEFAKASNSTNQYYSIYNNANGMQVANNTPASGQTPYIFFYCKKGDVINIAYNLGGTTARFRFVYAVGSESEAS